MCGFIKKYFTFVYKLSILNHKYKSLFLTLWFSSYNVIRHIVQHISQINNTLDVTAQTQHNSDHVDIQVRLQIWVSYTSFSF